MSTTQTTGGAMDAKEEFFRDLDDSNVSDESLRARVNDLPPDVFTPLNDVAGELKLEPYLWDQGYFISQKRAARYNFAKNRIDHLLDMRRKAHSEGWVGTRVSVPPTVGSGDSFPQETSSSKVRHARSFMPTDSFRKRFEGVPLAHAREAMKMELEDPGKSTTELQDLAKWCETQRADIFDPYQVSDFAPAIPDSPSGVLEDTDFYVQRGWLDSNFSKKRFLAIVTLRDLLRKQGKLPVWQRTTLSSIDGGAKTESTQGRSAGAEEDSLLFKKILEWIKDHIWLSLAGFAFFVLLVALTCRGWGSGSI